MEFSTTVRRISWRLLFVIIGIGLTLAYLQLKYQNVQVSFEQFTPGAQRWRQLGGDTGTYLMNNYRKEQGKIWPHYFRLRTGVADSILRGFWIDKAMLDTILARAASLPEHPDINGFNVFFGKWPDSAKRKYSLVVRATQKNGSDRKPTKDDDNTGIGGYFDMVDPCPDNCGGNN